MRTGSAHRRAGQSALQASAHGRRWRSRRCAHRPSALVLAPSRAVGRTAPSGSGSDGKLAGHRCLALMPACRQTLTKSPLCTRRPRTSQVRSFALASALTPAVLNRPALAGVLLLHVPLLRVHRLLCLLLHGADVGHARGERLREWCRAHVRAPTSEHAVTVQKTTAPALFGAAKAYAIGVAPARARPGAWGRRLTCTRRSVHTVRGPRRVDGVRLPLLRLRV
jgi:hypothetical protein